jgi:hypothetical protein
MWDWDEVEARVYWDACVPCQILSWPNILIRLLFGQSPKGVIDSEWLIVERMSFSARTPLFYPISNSVSTNHRTMT